MVGGEKLGALVGFESELSEGVRKHQHEKSKRIIKDALQVPRTRSGPSRREFAPSRLCHMSACRYRTCIQKTSVVEGCRTSASCHSLVGRSKQQGAFGVICENSRVLSHASSKLEGNPSAPSLELDKLALTYLVVSLKFRVIIFFYQPSNLVARQ